MFARTRSLGNAKKPSTRPRRVYLQQDILAGVPLSGDWWMAAAITLLVATIFALCVPALFHWFVVPVVLVGILMGTDACAWARGGMNLANPSGLIALLGYWGLFGAPLLHVALGYWLPYVSSPDDWRTWLGYMALLNLVSVFLYRAARRAFSRSDTRTPFGVARHQLPVIWVPRRLSATIAAGVLVSVSANLVIWWRFGGLAGFTTAFEENKQAFIGTGWLFGLSESLPVLVAFWLVARHWGAGRQAPSRSLTGAAFAALLAVPLLAAALTGLLRGSRLVLVFTVVWTVALYHLAVRRVPGRVLVACALLLLVAFYMFGFYKAAGVQGLLSSASSAQERGRLEDETGRTFTAVLLGDLSRADVQARVLYGTRAYSWSEYALGGTYVGAAANTLLFDTVWSSRPDSKSGPGTRALFGNLPSGVFRASNIYGLGGEALLNFGILGPPAAFLVLGALVGKVSATGSSLTRRDPRVLLLPLAILACVSLFLNDFDNVLYLVVAYGSLPIAVVVGGSGRWRPTARLGSAGALRAEMAASLRDDRTRS